MLASLNGNGGEKRAGSPTPGRGGVGDYQDTGSAGERNDFNYASGSALAPT
jgi:hypothetical protein